MFSFVIFGGLFLTCFFAPSIVRFHPDRDYLALKRFVLGGVAVWLTIVSITFVFHVTGLRIWLKYDLVFQFFGTSVFWVPLLFIRVVQIGLREGKMMASGHDIGEP